MNRQRTYLLLPACANKIPLRFIIVLISDFKLTSLLDLQVSISICKDVLICAKYVNDFF